MANKLRNSIKKMPVIGPALHSVYMRLFRGEGEVVTIAGGYLKGWKLHRFARTINKRHLAGDYEPFLQEVIVKELKPGQTFYDVGANAGFMSLVAARALNGGGRIVAFEPHPKTAEEARRQLKLNGVANAVVVAAATSSEAGFAELDDGGTSDMAKLASLDASKSSHKVKVQTVTLDEQFPKQGMPDVLKMDIEGAEMLALSGAGKMLAQGKATLLLEIHSEQLAAEIYPYLESFGYRFYRVSEKEITDREYVRFIIARKS